MSPGSRRAVGACVILAWLAAWIVGAAIVGDALAGAHPLAQLAYYAVAGIAWVVPLAPVFRWMAREG